MSCRGRRKLEFALFEGCSYRKSGLHPDLSTVHLDLPRVWAGMERGVSGGVGVPNHF